MFRPLQQLISKQKRTVASSIRSFSTTQLTHCSTLSHSASTPFHLIRRQEHNYPTVRSLIGNQRKASYDSNGNKINTNVVGVEVVPNAREVLVSLLEETINKARSYKEQFYNAQVIQHSEYMLRVIERCETNDEIEDELNLGQIEEVIEAVENQYDVLIELNENSNFFEPDDIADEEWFAKYGELQGESDPDLFVEVNFENFQKFLPDESIWEEIDQELGYKPTPKRTEEEWAEWRKRSNINKFFFEPQYPTEAPKPLSEQALAETVCDSHFPPDYDFSVFRWNTEPMPVRDYEQDIQQQNASKL